MNDYIISIYEYEIHVLQTRWISSVFELLISFVLQVIAREGTLKPFLTAVYTPIDMAETYQQSY